MASQALYIIDPVGAVGATYTLTLARAGSDTIETSASSGQTSYVISAPRQFVELRSDGTSKWVVSDRGDAAGLTFGTLPAARLPNPTSSTLGGVESLAAASHKWINAISTSGVPAASQPACADISDAAASCATNALNASNISSGTLPAARLPNPTSSTLGGVESLASSSHKWINTISTSGVPAASQPACADISDAGTGCSATVGTIATQSAASVAITGGSITGITDLAVADGGTGSSTASGARTNLGLGTAATQATGTSGANVPLLNGANTWSGAQTISAKLSAGQDAYLTGDISPTSLGADQNNYSPTSLSTASVLRLTSSTAVNITGLAGGADGRILAVLNVGSNDIVLKDASASSTAANRFDIGADVTLAASQGAVLIYDATSSRWRIAGLMSTASGGATSCAGLSDAGDGCTASFGANVGTFLATPSSANLAAALTDETGSGAVVLSTSATLSSATAAGFTSSQKTALTGDITPAEITANTDDYSPTGLSTATVLRLSTDAARKITGLAGGSDGRVITILDVGSNQIRLQDESIATSSSAGNRFAFGGGEVDLAPGGGVTLLYDATASRWRAMDRAGTLSVGPLVNTLTIASGAVTITGGSRYYLDTEGAAATDDLDTISGGVDGQILVLQDANSSHDVTVKNGTGNIKCGSDKALTASEDMITLIDAGGSSWLLPRLRRQRLLAGRGGQGVASSSSTQSARRMILAHGIDAQAPAPASARFGARRSSASCFGSCAVSGLRCIRPIAAASALTGASAIPAI